MAKAPRTSTNTAQSTAIAAALLSTSADTGATVLAAEYRADAAHPDAVIAKLNVEPSTPVGYVEPTTQGTVQVNPPLLSDAEAIARSKQERADKAAAEKQEKADKKAAADKATADAKAAKEAEKATKKADAEAAKAAKAADKAKAKTERDARMAELAQGRAGGSMLALADRVKQGVYVKSATGQLHSGDELATALDGISATDVIRIGLDVLKLEDNPYAALNVGQQSMNLRNKMRGAIKKEVLTLESIKAYVERNKIVQVTATEIAQAKADRKAKIEANKAERAAKAAVKAPALDTAGNAMVDGKTPGQIDAERAAEATKNVADTSEQVAA